MFIGENQQKRGGSKDGFQPDAGISGHPLLVRANNSWQETELLLLSTNFTA